MSRILIFWGLIALLCSACSVQTEVLSEPDGLTLAEVDGGTTPDDLSGTEDAISAEVGGSDAGL